jgi:hypothetical protein
MCADGTRGSEPPPDSTSTCDGDLFNPAQRRRLQIRLRGLEELARDLLMEKDRPPVHGRLFERDPLGAAGDPGVRRAAADLLDYVMRLADELALPRHTEDPLREYFARISLEIVSAEDSRSRALRAFGETKFDEAAWDRRIWELVRLLREIEHRLLPRAR